MLLCSREDLPRSPMYSMNGVVVFGAMTSGQAVGATKSTLRRNMSAFYQTLPWRLDTRLAELAGHEL